VVRYNLNDLTPEQKREHLQKPGPRKKKRKSLSRRAKKKMDDGRKDLEDACMDLWRKIVSCGMTVCVWCLKPARVYQCHHIITKGSSKALKYDTDNGIFLCQGCHYRAHNSGSMDFAKFYEENYPGKYEKLLLRKKNKIDLSKSGLIALKNGLEHELNCLEENN